MPSAFFRFCPRHNVSYTRPSWFMIQPASRQQLPVDVTHASFPSSVSQATKKGIRAPRAFTRFHLTLCTSRTRHARVLLASWISKKFLGTPNDPRTFRRAGAIRQKRWISTFPNKRKTFSKLMKNIEEFTGTFIVDVCLKNARNFSIFQGITYYGNDFSMLTIRASLENIRRGNHCWLSNTVTVETCLNR